MTRSPSPLKGLLNGHDAVQASEGPRREPVNLPTYRLPQYRRGAPVQTCHVMSKIGTHPALPPSRVHGMDADRTGPFLLSGRMRP